MPRYSVDLTLDEVQQVKAIAAKEDRTLASMLRCLVRRQLHVGNLLENGVNQLRFSKDQDMGTRARGSSSQKEEKKEEQKKSTAASGVTVRIIGRINELRPKAINGKVLKGFVPGTYEKPIADLLKRGFTEMDLITVVEHKAEEHRASRDWRWFKPATLFRVRSFAEKLDEALAGVPAAVARTNTQPGKRGLFKQYDDDARWLEGCDDV